MLARIFICLLFLMPCVAGAEEKLPQGKPLLLCAGGKEMFIIDADLAAKGKIEKLWKWSGTTAEGIAEEHRTWFGNLDECRGIEDGKKILVCASNSGCALIERPSGKVLWYASVTNAHSIELLPKNRVVVASSLSGDRLVVFDLAKSLTPVYKTDKLKSAHGVIWDAKRECLWALNFDELRQYKLKDWDTQTPSLELSKKYTLPDEDGHDLRAVPGGDELILTTEKSIHRFHREKGTFKTDELSGKWDNVKSIDIHPESGRVAIGRWRKEMFLASPEGKITFSDATPYKIRWFQVGSAEKK